MTLTQSVLSKPISEIKGKMFKICGNETGHGFNVGDKVKLQQKDGRYFTVVHEQSGQRNNVYGSDLQLITPDKEEVKILALEAKQKADELAECLAFLEESGAGVLDDIAFQVWKIMKIMENPDKEEQKIALYTLLKS